MAKKNTFVSDVTGESWTQYGIKHWADAINHEAILLEDVKSKNKDGSMTTLEKGSKVFIDDIRGRIDPQYRCKSQEGKVWFIASNKIEIIKQEGRTREEDIGAHEYQGGVRVDDEAKNNG
tara:strand:+ start:307 stop:666 length:360 start_codon:yes stop_codon:yes gene_type:complete